MTGLKDHLKQKRGSIVPKWLTQSLQAYPGDASGFYLREKNQFANPVGSSFAEVVEKIFDALLEEVEVETLQSALEGVIKIRSVQEFTPSQAISFVFELKQLVRQELNDELSDPALRGELVGFENRVDQLALVAFNVYMSCREKVCEIRVREVKRRVSRLLHRTGLIESDADLEPNGPPGNGSRPYPNQGGSR